MQFERFDTECFTERRILQKIAESRLKTRVSTDRVYIRATKWQM